MTYRDNMFEVGDRVKVYATRSKQFVNGNIIALSAIDVRIKLDNGNKIRVSLADLEKALVTIDPNDE